MSVIGVLALQGDFAEHAVMLERLGAEALAVKSPAQLDLVDGLIIPGGESTAIDRLTADGALYGHIQTKVRAGMPVYGTCMGSIFLAAEIEGSRQGRLAVMDIVVRRNAFGPQKSSFELSLDIADIGPQPFPAVFIRAPLILKCGEGVRVMASIGQGIVMARQENILVTTFHPELTSDTRVHEYFLTMVDSCHETLASAGRSRMVNRALSLAFR